MRVFAPSAVTATTTSGFGNGLGRGSQSKNSRSHLKLILCCVLPYSCPHTKFHPNWTKNKEVKMISYRLASVGWHTVFEPHHNFYKMSLGRDYCIWL